jgi:hypothetical protein
LVCVAMPAHEERSLTPEGVRDDTANQIQIHFYVRGFDWRRLVYNRGRFGCRGMAV